MQAKHQWVRAHFIFLCLVSIPLFAQPCREYRGYWVQDRGTEFDRFRSEIYFPDAIQFELRTYFTEQGMPTEIEHGFGSLKDSMGLCYARIDTGKLQFDGSGHVVEYGQGDWFLLYPLNRNQDGVLVMQEIRNDGVESDTLETRRISESTQFTIMPLFLTSGIHRSSQNLRQRVPKASLPSSIDMLGRTGAKNSVRQLQP